MNPQDVNLSNCDREPIHQLGRIQGFGALIAVNSDWFVAHRSTNLEALFGAGRTVEIGDRLSQLLSPANFLPRYGLRVCVPCALSPSELLLFP